MSTQRDPVADELAIRNLVARYSDAVIRDDGDDWRACWHPDAVWMLGPGRFEGIDAAFAQWQVLMGLFEHVWQIPQHGWVETDGDTARGRWYVNEYGQRAESFEPTFSFGVYHDHYAWRDGAWRFASRRFDILQMGTSDFAGQVMAFPADPFAA